MIFFKRFFYIFLILNILGLSNVFSIKAMEIERNQEKGIKKSWNYRKRERIDVCCVSYQDERKYPCFLSNKQEGNFIPNVIMQQKYGHWLGGDCDIASLNDENKQALWFVLRSLNSDKRLRIEGRDKEFAQKMSQHILELPLQIRQAIATKYGTDMVSNTLYESSRLDIVLDHEAHKECCACSVASVGTVINYHKFCLLTGYNPVCMLIGSPILLPMFCLLYKCMNRCLSETAEEKDERLGFEAIPLLREMESTIVEIKEKQD